MTRAGDDNPFLQLARERDAADRDYNDALTALDEAVQRLREMPHPPPVYDDHQVSPLNARWELLSQRPPEPEGRRWWLHRWVRRQVWTVLGPLFERQQDFNAVLVDHVNRNVDIHQATAQAIESTIVVMGEELQDFVRFQSKLIQWAQQITPYVDTKDREVAGMVRGVAAGLNGLSDELQKRWESMEARDRRYDARDRQHAARSRQYAHELAVRDQQHVQLLNERDEAYVARERKQLEEYQARERQFQADLQDVRNTLGVVHRATQTLKHALEERWRAASAATMAPVASEAVPSAGGAAQPASSNAGPSLDSYKYVGFEDEFRGSEEEIKARQSAYLDLFRGAGDVLDVGCGRGEFLELLREHGVTGRGIEVNEEMAAICRDKGLECEAGDAVEYLRGLPDGSLGGFFAAQVVEHLRPAYLVELLELGHRKLRPGAKIVLETINPACWFAFFASYIRDITHEQPLHPDTLRYLVGSNGFQKVEVRYSAAFPEEGKLQPVVLPPTLAPPKPDDTEALVALREAARIFNQNVTNLNGLLFTYLDYAIVGEKV